MYRNTGQAVQVSSSNKVVLSDDARGATTFQLLGCRASSIVPAAQRPSCVSLADADLTDWYLRDGGFYLKVDPEYETEDLPLFTVDSSFILHIDTFYQGTYALQSVNFRDHYIMSDVDGNLTIAQQDDIADYNDTASFRIYDYDSAGMYSRFVC